MSYRRILAIVIRHLYVWPRNMDRLMGSFGWPILEITIWGITMSYFQQNLSNSLSVLTVILGSVIMWQILARTQTEISIVFLDEVWNKNLINIFSSPLTKAEFLVSIVLLNTIKIFFTILSLMIVGYFYFKFNLISSFGLYLPFLLLNLLLVGWSVGFFVIGVIMRFGYRVQELAWAIFLVTQPFSCVFYPISALPPWAQSIALLLPSSYLFEEMRNILSKNSINMSNLYISFTLNIIYLSLSIWFFSAMFEKAREQGRLVKLN
ncbi:MAG: ABC transporter permease [Patescibacteria group bacterium]